MSTYSDIITAARLVFKSTDPERQRAGKDWLRQLVAGLDEAPSNILFASGDVDALNTELGDRRHLLKLPEGIPNPPDGFTYYGLGPLQVIVRDKETDEGRDVAKLCHYNSRWTINWVGDGAGAHYALRTGSEIAKANGLP